MKVIFINMCNYIKQRLMKDNINLFLDNINSFFLSAREKIDLPYKILIYFKHFFPACYHVFTPHSSALIILTI